MLSGPLMIHPSVLCLMFCVMDVHALLFLGNAQCGVQMQIARNQLHDL
jgi:hypothetical protein